MIHEMMKTTKIRCAELISGATQFIRNMILVWRHLSLMCIMQLACSIERGSNNAHTVSSSTGVDTSNASALRIMLMSKQSSSSQLPVSWNATTFSVIIGAMATITMWLPFSANPLHIAVVVLCAVGFMIVAVFTSPPVATLAARHLVASSSADRPPSKGWSLRSTWVALVEVAFRWVLVPHAHSTTVLFFLGLGIVLQLQFSLRYTAVDASLLNDNGMSCTTPTVNHQYGAKEGGAIFAFEKTSFQVCLLQMLFGFFLRVPLLHVMICSGAHFVALLAQIPPREQLGSLDGTIFTAAMLWFALPITLSSVALWPLRYAIIQLEQRSSKYDAVVPSSTCASVPSAATCAADDALQRSGSERVITVNCVEDSCASKVALLDGADRTGGAASPISVHKPMFACRSSGSIANDDDGALKSPSLVLDMNGVIVDANAAFCSLCGVEASMLLHRSLESVLEWFDVDAVGEVMSALRTVARTQAVSRESNGTSNPKVLKQSANPLDLCLSLSDFAVESTWPQRILIRGYGTPDAAAAGDDADAAFSPREGSHGQSLVSSGVTPCEGRFAVVVDAVKVRSVTAASTSTISDPSPQYDRIVLRQPIMHSALNAFPAPLFLFQRSSGAIILWNASLARLTHFSPFHMLGTNAYQEVLGNGSIPFTLPQQDSAVFPMLGECNLMVGEVGASKTVGFTVLEWPSHQNTKVLLCIIEKGLSHRWSSNNVLGGGGANVSSTFGGGNANGGVGGGGGAGGRGPTRSEIFSHQLLNSLFRIVVDFNRQAGLIGSGPRQKIERLEVFADAVIQLTKSFALSQVQHQRGNNNYVDMLHTPTRSSSYNMSRADTVHQLPNLPLAPPPAGAWGRLVSQDGAICDSCIMTSPLGKEFTFGRSAKCSLCIADTFVSSVQFSIVRKAQGAKGAQVILIDHSVNGSFVNVRKVGKGKSCALHHNDLITFRLSSSRFFLGFVFQLLDDRFSAVGTSTAGGVVGAPPISLPGGMTSPAAATNTKSSVTTAPSSAATPSQKKKKAGNNPATQRATIEWKIGEEVLGKGGNAEVYLGINLTNGKLIAVKRVPLPKDTTTLRQYQILQDEIAMLSTAEHPNIVHYFGSSQSDTHLNILLEFVPGGSLRHLLDNFGALGDGVVLSYLEQTLQGLCYLHSRNIVHSDIKAANILVTDKGQVKLTDFGTATLLTHAHTIPGVTNTMPNAGSTFTVVGTLLWMAPELVRGESVATKASDMWSLGCAIVEMITSEFPWNEYQFESEEQIANLLRYVAEPPEIPETKNPLISRIAAMCLQLDPAKRPTCDELLHMLVSSRQQTPQADTQQTTMDGDQTHQLSGDLSPVLKEGTTVGSGTMVSQTGSSNSTTTLIAGGHSGQWTLSSEFSHFMDEVELAQKLIHEC